MSKLKGNVIEFGMIVDQIVKFIKKVKIDVDCYIMWDLENCLEVFNLLLFIVLCEYDDLVIIVEEIGDGGFGIFKKCFIVFFNDYFVFI